MRKGTEKYTIDNYGKKSTFASFLPGIAGIRGIPIWCYYVNRGQGVVSFGVDNKDHSIMEFYPAQVAYQSVEITGFRTFIRRNGTYFEAFSNKDHSHKMDIYMNKLKIEEWDESHELKVQVTYFTLPGEKIGGLVRCLKITNCSEEQVELEVLDGMPLLIPYGVSLENMKNMTQTAKAWMQVEEVKENVPYYRVRASMEDTAAVKAIEGGNFSYGCLETGQILQPVVDPKTIFSYDTSLKDPVNFRQSGITGVKRQEQRTQNVLPCSFYGAQRTLEPREELTVYELIGQVENREILTSFFAEKKAENYFTSKEREADDLTEELTSCINTRTASREFDAYCRYTYMDNVLRGGLPMKLGNNKIFYVYSRKHGDLERDYNYFSMLPEFYSQGNGNYRDVDQNRRCDTFFAPFVGRENIHSFYSLIQLDGYNPLGVEKITYQIDPAKAEQLLAEVEPAERNALKDFLRTPFTPGSLYLELDKVLKDSWDETLFYQIIDYAENLVNGNFLEGYWSDHWTYDLDLIEEYLELEPQKEREMLYENTYTYFLGQAKVDRRKRRYVKTERGLRQYRALEKESLRNTKEKLVRTAFGRGEIVKGTLLEKLLLLCATKFATLDAYGMGVEMEGGRPGWYDALNGLPAMFGSSMAETYELARLMDYCIRAMERNPGQLTLMEELASFVDELTLINHIEEEDLKTKDEVMGFWNRINDTKEIYRDKTYDGVSGKCRTYDTKQLVADLREWRRTVQYGIEKAGRLSKQICPTYFTYEVTEYVEEADGLIPLHFKVQQVPAFLEGPVRYLKLEDSPEHKRDLYQRIRHSDLYDEKLQMYKVNASLEKASYELGRARAFTPGWLENESIWLHMEYKYLLELLKSGLYEEFFADFKKAAVPFLDPETYGRSIYENSSFIASSKNPDPSIHGKGFVARLSGSTIEFISIWKRMMFGAHLFYEKEGDLVFAPAPAIPDYLVPEDGRVGATLFGSIQVTYIFPDQKTYLPGCYQIEKISLSYRNGSIASMNNSCVKGKMAKDIQNGQVKKIEIEIGELKK